MTNYSMIKKKLVWIENADKLFCIKKVQ